jgi:hypothetical protein
MTQLRHAIELWLLRRRIKDFTELTGGTCRAVEVSDGWSVAFAVSIPGVDRTFSAATYDDQRTALFQLATHLKLIPAVPLTGWRRLWTWVTYRPE